jgi:hypothetical protein
MILVLTYLAMALGCLQKTIEPVSLPGEGWLSDTDAPHSGQNLLPLGN